MYRAKERGCDLRFVWIPSHVDCIVKSACDKQSVDINLGVAHHTSLKPFKEDLTELTNTQEPESYSIKHYDCFMQDVFVLHVTTSYHLMSWEICLCCILNVECNIT